jgi:hypothetical protein
VNARGKSQPTDSGISPQFSVEEIHQTPRDLFALVVLQEMAGFWQSIVRLAGRAGDVVDEEVLRRA